MLKKWNGWTVDRTVRLGCFWVEKVVFCFDPIWDLKTGLNYLTWVEKKNTPVVTCFKFQNNCFQFRNALRLAKNAAVPSVTSKDHEVVHPWPLLHRMLHSSPTTWDWAERTQVPSKTGCWPVRKRHIHWLPDRVTTRSCCLIQYQIWPVAPMAMALSTKTPESQRITRRPNAFQCILISNIKC